MTDTGMPNIPVSRRDFVGRTSLAAIALSARPAAASAHPLPDATVRPSDPVSRVSELDEVSLSELAEGMANGRWTSRSVVATYLDAIERIDRRGPTLRSVLEVNPDALDIAASLDEERRRRGPRGPLHGVPVLVKDCIGTADRMHTSAGSFALAQFIAPRDAFIVERLRAAGAVILGKANMSEWGNARGRGSTGGWSGRGGLTHNPYVLDRSAGGSSAGTAAAVSANLCAVAVGTESMGSIVSPSSMCGVVGMKPTVGLISRTGNIPVSLTQDTPGPMCRTVRDAALLLNVLAAPDPADAATTDPARRAIADYSRVLDPDGLRGARIGVARNLFGVSILGDRVIQRALESLRAAGAEIVDPADIATANAIWTFDAEVLSYELKAALNEFLAAAPAAPVRNLADIIAFNNRNSDRELAWFGQETFEYAQTLGPLTSAGYLAALRMVRQLARTDGLDRTIATHRLDAIVAPAQSPAWLSDLLLGDNSMLGSFVPPAAAGYPSITVPAGDVAGLPVGILFMGSAWSEPTLLRLAFAFEQQTRARRAPTFLGSVTARP